jgi:hypothetical protein
MEAVGAAVLDVVGRTAAKHGGGSGRPGLLCYIKAEIQEVTLLLRIQQI